MLYWHFTRNKDGPAVLSIMPATGRLLYLRSGMIGLVAGAVVAGHLPWLLPIALLAPAAVALLALPRRLASVCLGVALGCALVSVQGREVLQRRLADDCSGRVFEVRGRVVSLPRDLRLEQQRRRQRFEFEVESLSPAICAGPQRILLSWYGEQDILPGQEWRFQVRLRRPWGLANQGSFNMQGWYVLTGIDAVGSAREQGAALLGEGRGQRVNLWRREISRAITLAGLEPRAAAVIKAVTVADKSGIDHGLWSLFQRLGVNHLLVISGLHVGMVAGLGLVLGQAASQCLRATGLHANFPAALVAGAVAAVYTALAGFSVATQRALFMLLCFILASALGRTSSGSQKLLLAAVLVILVNPLAPLGSGFWLSFSAVAALLWLAHWYRSCGRLRQVLVAHVYMGLLMLPLGGFWFGGGSWLSAPANLLMVPLVGLYVVPLSLAGVALLVSGIPGYESLWELAQLPLSLLFQHAAGALDGAGLVPLYAGLATSVVAVLALGLLLVPGGLRRKCLLPVLWLPLLLPPAAAIDGPQVDVLDVGQGTAVVVRAAGRVLLYDTGGGNPAGANLAQSVVIPYLRSQGVAAIDSLVVSHGDQDHSAGLAAILDSFAVGAIWLGGGQESVAGSRQCRAGIAWRWGEQAKFQFLSPASVEGLSDNDASCVLAIDLDGWRFLLAGDIEALQERQLVSYWQGELASDVLLVAHHGSGTSSSQSFLNRVDPQLALINNADGNHFGHPAPDVLERLQGQGVGVRHTALSGALALAPGEGGALSIAGRREGIRPWWM